MGGKLRWLIVGSVIGLFIIVALLRKEKPTPISEAVMPTPSQALETAVSTSTSPPIPAPIQPTTHPLDNQPPPSTHIIQMGETLFSIATTYNLTVDELAAANNILDPSQILVAQLLTIPGETVLEMEEETATLASSGQATSASSGQAISPLSTPAPQLATSNQQLETISNLSPETRQHIKEIYANGQQIGRNPRAFSKLGDSTIMAPGLLVQFDRDAYNLGDFAYLQSVIDYYAGSFERYGAATHVGLHSWTVFDPMIADKTWCFGNETLLACEFRLHNPSILFIRLGSNDAGIPESFDQHTREAVQYTIDNGIIPIIGTKADRFEGEDNINNKILRQIAADYNVPLWDFDTIAETLPNRGLDPEDNVHISKTAVTNDYTQPAAFQSGQAMQDLSALLMLEAVLQEINN
jgi:LysM repeat protein